MPESLVRKYITLIDDYHVKCERSDKCQHKDCHHQEVHIRDIECAGDICQIARKKAGCKPAKRDIFGSLVIVQDNLVPPEVRGVDSGEIVIYRFTINKKQYMVDEITYQSMLESEKIPIGTVIKEFEIRQSKEMKVVKTPPQKSKISTIVI